MMTPLSILATRTPGPVMPLFDDDPVWVEQLKEGDGTASLVLDEVHHGTAAELQADSSSLERYLGVH